MGKLGDNVWISWDLMRFYGTLDGLDGFEMIGSMNGICMSSLEMWDLSGWKSGNWELHCHI